MAAGVIHAASAGHLVHVALPASRGQSTDWSNLLHQLPHPAGLKIYPPWACFRLRWNSVEDMHPPSSSFRSPGSQRLLFQTNSELHVEWVDIFHRPVEAGYYLIATESHRIQLTPSLAAYFIMVPRVGSCYSSMHLGAIFTAAQHS